MKNISNPRKISVETKSEEEQFSDRYEMDDADSQTLRQSTSWLSAGEGYSDGTAYHSAIRKEHVERKMPIDKQKDYAVEVQGRRAEKESRNVRLGCPVRQRHEIRQKEGDKREKARRKSSEPFLSLYFKRKTSNLSIKAGSKN